MCCNPAAAYFLDNCKVYDNRRITFLGVCFLAQSKTAPCRFNPALIQGIFTVGTDAAESFTNAGDFEP